MLLKVNANDNVMRLYNYGCNSKFSGKSTTAAQQNKPECKKQDGVSKKQKIGVEVCSALGIAGSLMLLAKHDKKGKYTVNPKKMFKGKFKDSYLMNAHYKSKEVAAMGAGSIMGGLAGGAMLDKKEHAEAKVREAVVQMTNFSMPIMFVEAMCVAGRAVSNKIMPGWEKSKLLTKKAASKIPSAAGSMVGLLGGMYVANRLSNKFNEKIFHKKDDRPIKCSDFTAHVDDMCVAATIVADNNPITKAVGRLIPLAPLVAGYQTGIKREAAVNQEPQKIEKYNECEDNSSDDLY